MQGFPFIFNQSASQLFQQEHSETYLVEVVVCPGKIPQDSLKIGLLLFEVLCIPLPYLPPKIRKYKDTKKQATARVLAV